MRNQISTYACTRLGSYLPVSLTLSLFSLAENYRQSALDVLNGKYQGHQTAASQDSTNYVEQSWMYACCLKCRGEEPTESWSPSFWQKIFPYPLCPTFRTFSRLIVLILIGKQQDHLPFSCLSSNDILLLQACFSGSLPLWSLETQLLQVGSSSVWSCSLWLPILVAI